MKNIIKKIIFGIISFEAKLVLLRYKPRIVAVSGTVGKTGAKDMIYHIMSERFHVRKTNKSLNGDIGIPLTVLGHESGWDSPLKWFKIMFSGFVQIFYSSNYPKWLVVETGIDRPGDMDKIAKFLKPEIVVITAFGSVPAHVEYFDNPEDVMAEEAKLMDYVREGGSIILNADDPDVLNLKSKSKVKTYTYGYENPDSDMLATNKSTVYDASNSAKIPLGIAFKVEYEGNVVPTQINGVLGDTVIYPVVAAITVGKILGISPVTSCPRVNTFVPAPGRMSIVPGINGSTIIDDTYNASPLAVEKALKALAEVECTGKKIAVLGDMLEIGRFSNSAHNKVGEDVAGKQIDYLVTVGMRSQTIAESANEHGMLKKRIFMFKDSVDAIETVKGLLNESEGNVLLAKGSQGVRIEKIVREVIENPLESAKLLVRQEKEWLNR
jgi:UDP-N-acetylmuramoyl-tripeptide--D-alanyl-D-alanine ligase